MVLPVLGYPNYLQDFNDDYKKRKMITVTVNMVVREKMETREIHYSLGSIGTMGSFLANPTGQVSKKISKRHRILLVLA